MTAVSTKLVIYVPKTIMTYQCRKLDGMIAVLTAELADTEDLERQLEVLSKIDEINRMRAVLNNELGRV